MYKRQIQSAAVALCSILLFLCVYNNCESYDTPIAKVTEVSEKASGSGSVDQSLTGVVKNGDFRGQTIHLENTYEESLVYDDRYSEGDFLFVTIHSADENTDDSAVLTGSVTGVKRDYYVALTLIVLLALLVLAGGKQGIFTILGLTVNISLFCVLLMLYGTCLLYTSRCV